MPEPSPNIPVQIPACAVATARTVAGLPISPEPFTCDWAKKGLADALKGMQKAATGVQEYRIGTRYLKRGGSEDQIKNVDYWNQMVQLYCGEPGLPPALTGRDSAARVVLRDI